MLSIDTCIGITMAHDMTRKRGLGRSTDYLNVGAVYNPRLSVFPCCKLWAFLYSQNHLSLSLVCPALLTSQVVSSGARLPPAPSFTKVLCASASTSAPRLDRFDTQGVDEHDMPVLSTKVILGHEKIDLL
jgi:hypothetical protein